MPSKISYNQWDGGQGCSDRVILIGYCKEEPKEVLAKVLYTHDIMRYRDLYRPIDDRFPNNVAGLIVDEIKESSLQSRMVGVELKITGSLEDLDLSLGETTLARNPTSFADAIIEMERWHLGDTLEENNSKMYKRVRKQINEVITVCVEVGAIFSKFREQSKYIPKDKG